MTPGAEVDPFSSAKFDAEQQLLRTHCLDSYHPYSSTRSHIVDAVTSAAAVQWTQTKFSK